MSRGIKYTLDVDDVIREDLATQANANALLTGLNTNATVSLAVRAGGTGSISFADGEFITYSSSLKRLVSSGNSLVSTYTKAELDTFFASKNLGKYQVDYQNVVNGPVMVRFTQTFLIPAVGSTGASLLTNPHNFSSYPDSVRWQLVCKANTVGHLWVVGDRFDVSIARYNDTANDPIFCPFEPAANDRLGCLLSKQADDVTDLIFLKSGNITDDFTISFANLQANFDIVVVASRFQ